MYMRLHLSLGKCTCLCLLSWYMQLNICSVVADNEKTKAKTTGLRKTLVGQEDKGSAKLPVRLKGTAGGMSSVTPA